MQLPIGFFDSGIGGLTVLKTAAIALPQENFIYLGDNENAPYGNKSKDEIISLAIFNVGKLIRLNVKAVVIACNTVTAEAVSVLREKFNIKIIGMEPCVKSAKKLCGDKKFVVYCTASTASSEKFNRLLSDINANCIVIPEKNLAADIEKNIFNLNSIMPENIITDDIKAVVLGCTHYIFIKDIFKKLYPNAEILDGNSGSVNNLKNYLTENNMLNKNGAQKISFKGNCAEKNRLIFSRM